MSSYQPGIPSGSVDLDIDYQNLQNNFTALNIIFGANHTQFANNTPQQGYHTVINLIPPSTTATNAPNNYPPNGYTVTPGYGQIFAPQVNDGVDTDESLYFLSGGNKLTQLTRNLQPSTTNSTGSSSGTTFIAGGFVFQWGTVTQNFSGTTTGTTNFNITFPQNLFYVIGVPLFSASSFPGSQASVNIRKSNLGTGSSTSQFNWQFNTNSDDYTGFSWIALGN